jgi:YHS domain-containing protein
MLQSLKKLSLSLFLAVGVVGIARAADDAPAKKDKPYPLTTCVVSGEKLDSMGKPKVIQYEGREVRFCCDHCEPEFRKDPAKYLKKLDDAAKEQPKEKK